MERFPPEFADWLSARGRRLLERGDAALAQALARERLVYVQGVLARDAVLAGHALLERALAGALVPLARAIPPESIANQTRDGQERLIKVVRARTAALASRRSRARRAAERIGLIRFLRSGSLRRFAEVLSGAALDPESGQQALRYGPGDYAGPHTDHVPENPRARDGYVDLHLGLPGPGVRAQQLVWAVDGHFTRSADLARGGIALYRLPLWHYTTPLQVHAPDASRWVLLATFLFARGARAAIAAPSRERR